MAARFTMDELVHTLAASGATYSVAPGMRVTATFGRRDQRDGLRDRYLGADIAVAGQTIRLAHERGWIDEHGFGLVLTP